MLQHTTAENSQISPSQTTADTTHYGRLQQTATDFNALPQLPHAIARDRRLPMTTTDYRTLRRTTAVYGYRRLLQTNPQYSWLPLTTGYY